MTNFALSTALAAALFSGSVQAENTLRVQPFAEVGVAMLNASDYSNSSINAEGYRKDKSDHRSYDFTRPMVSIGIEATKGMFGGYVKMNSDYVSVGPVLRFSRMSVFAGVTSLQVWDHEDMHAFMKDSRQDGALGRSCSDSESIPFEIGMHTNGKVQFVAVLAESFKETTCKTQISSGITGIKDLIRRQDTTYLGIGIRYTFK